MALLIQKHAHVKGHRSNHHIFKFQPNPSWAKKRPNRHTSFTVFPEEKKNAEQEKGQLFTRAIAGPIYGLMVHFLFKLGYMHFSILIGPLKFLWSPLKS